MVKRIAIIGTVGIPACYGGFETLAEQLVIHLGERFRFTVYCSAGAYPERLPNYGTARLKFLPLKATGPQSTVYDIWSMADALRERADALLVLGVSGAAVIPVLRGLGVRSRIVVNIDGLEWQRAKWGALARRFLRASEHAAVRAADVVIADNAVIESYVRGRYGVSPALIEYGADHVSPEPPDEATQRFAEASERGYAFSVCRIEPENNIHVVLESFATSADLPIVIVGNWDRSRYGRGLRARYGGNPRCVLVDPIYDPKRLNSLRSNCAMYVHGHSAGGTNPSLIEAMQLGRAIAAFDVGYNRVTTEEKAMYFRTAEDLTRVVCTVGATERRREGAALAEVAARRYTWKRIAEAYARVLEGGS